MTRYTKLGVETEFFNNLREGSRVKQRIVTNYFTAYNNVMAPRHPKVGYADLFAGPGVYVDNAGQVQNSIPILICEEVVRTELFRQKIHLWFNDGDPKHSEQLGNAVNAVPGLETLKYKPKIGNKIIDSGWVSKLSRLPVPTLLFLDPCGYKGLSLRLVASAIRGHGNDCIFFFNYSRINMKLDLEIMNASIDEFFEVERAAALRSAIKNRTPAEREEFILEAVQSAIKQAGAIPQVFRFRSANGRISHHLIYASKSAKAAQIMKSILRSASSEVSDGVGSSEHDPRSPGKTGSLFSGMYEVEDHLISVFAGREMTFASLLSEEVETRFTEGNYRDAILELEREGSVTVDPPADKRRFQAGGEKRTLPKEVRISFKNEERHGN